MHGTNSSEQLCSSIISINKRLFKFYFASTLIEIQITIEIALRNSKRKLFYLVHKKAENTLPFGFLWDFNAQQKKSLTGLVTIETTVKIVKGYFSQ